MPTESALTVYYAYMLSVTRAFQLPYLHFTAICLGLIAFFLYFWGKRFALLWDQYRRKRNPPAPYDPRLLQWYKNAVTFWSVMLFFGILLLVISFYLAGFQYIGKKVGISGLVTRNGNRVHFIGSEGRRLEASVRGPQTAAAGVFIRFPNWMRHLGVRTYHRMATFRGNHQTEFHYGKKPDSRWLKSYLNDPVLLFLYKHQDLLRPAINVFYTESVYFSGNKKRLIVTNQGYIIQ
jgi:hypothetical protein